MGYSASAKMVYGVKRSISDLEVTSRKRGCSHPQTNDRFCGQCGKPMFVHTTHRIEIEANGVEVHYSDYESNERVVGIALGAETNGIQLVAGFDPKSLAARVLDACQNAGLDVTGLPMGLYQLLVHSY